MRHLQSLISEQPSHSAEAEGENERVSERERERERKRVLRVYYREQVIL